MAVRVYWAYHFRNPEMEASIATDPGETQVVRGLREGRIVAGGSDVSTSGMSKFIPWECERTRDQMIAVFLSRCWRLPDCYAVLGGEATADRTLIVRRIMLDVPLLRDVKRGADAVLAKCAGNTEAAINRPMRRHLRSLRGRQDFDVRLAWEIYYHRALEKAGASILVVEDLHKEGFWSNVRQQILAASTLKVHRTGPHTFVVGDAPLREHEVDIMRMTCACSEFRNCGRPIGLHCRHLVAALQEAGMWDRYWGDYVPAAAPAGCADATVDFFEDSKPSQRPR